MIISALQNPPPIDFDAWLRGESINLRQPKTNIFLREADANFYLCVIGLISRWLRDEDFPFSLRESARERAEANLAFSLLGEAVANIYPEYGQYLKDIRNAFSLIRLRRPDGIIQDCLHRVTPDPSRPMWIERPDENQRIVVWKNPENAVVVVKPSWHSHRIVEPYAAAAWPSLMHILSSAGIFKLKNPLIFWKSYSGNQEWWVQLPSEKTSSPEFDYRPSHFALAQIAGEVSATKTSKRIADWWISRKKQSSPEIAPALRDELYDEMVRLSRDFNKVIKRV